MIIHICGIDGSGKTSLVRNLTKVYNNSSFVELSSSVKLVNQVNRVCDKCDSTRWKLFDNYFRSILWANELLSISDNFEEDKIYFLDRYKLCNYVYSQIEDNSSMNILRKIHSLIPDPDYTIFLDVSPVISRDRIIKRGGKLTPKESLSNLYLARKLYLKYLKTSNSVFKVNANEEQDKVLKSVVNIINKSILKEIIYD